MTNYRHFITFFSFHLTNEKIPHKEDSRGDGGGGGL